MARKPSALEAQLMTFRQCMAVCSLDMARQTWQKGGLLGVIALGLTLVVLLWDYITQLFGLIGSALWAILVFLNAEGILKGLIVGLYVVFIWSVGAAYDLVNKLTSWATPFIHSSHICETVGEGDAMTLVCNTSDTALNFLALAIAGVFALLVNSLWMAPALALKRIVKGRDYYNSPSPREHFIEAIGDFRTRLPQLAAFWILGCIAAGLMGNYSMPLLLNFLPATSSIYAWTLLLFPAVFIFAPLALLYAALNMSLEETRGELMYKLNEKATYETIFDYDKKGKLMETIRDLQEPAGEWLPRIFAISLAGIVFVVACYLGYTVAPEGYGLLGLLTVAVITLAMLINLLASLITCYVNVRPQAQQLVRAIDEFEVTPRTRREHDEDGDEDDEKPSDTTSA